MSPEIHRLKAAGNCDLYVRVWRAPEAKATVLVSHGHGEHGGRYEHVAARLNREGWDVIVPDHRGHGQSGGVRGHVLRWAEYAEDLDMAARKLAAPGLPWALIGHSMGGLIAVDYALTHQTKLKALVLSSPLLKLAFPVPPLKAIVGRALSNLIPALNLPTGLDSKAVSRDASVVAAYEADKLVHDRASTRWFTEMVSALAQAEKRAGELQIPVLVFHAGGDQLTDPEGSRVFFKNLTAKERHFKEWPGLYHEIFNEPEKEQVFDEMIAWLRPYLRG
jgi:alpha-beta hydrolase superfamily lysophospholipase